VGCESLILRLLLCLQPSNGIPMILLVLALSSLVGASGYYAPDLPPRTFEDGERIQLWVNSLTSTRTQLPRDYYRLPFCTPQGGPVAASENLGEKLTGNKVQSSPYVINVGENAYCQLLCEKMLDRTDAAKLRLHIKYGYHNNWILDNLPGATIGRRMNGEEEKRYAGGFPIGFMNPDDNMPYVFNHVGLFIKYQEVAGRKRIVGFDIEPMSVNHRSQAGQTHEEGAGESQSLLKCTGSSPLQHDDEFFPQVVKQQESLLYTYDATWERSDVEWSSRWDVYLSEDHLVPSAVHWYSIINSIFVVLILSSYIACAMVRNLRHEMDLSKAEPPADAATFIKLAETNWTSLHADVFRPPSNSPTLYCVFLGSGAQLCLTGLLVLILSAIGLLSPARRGSLLNAFLILYVLTGPIAGYVSCRIYKTFNGKQWQKCALLTATFFPGTAFGIFLVLCVVQWILHVVAAPFAEMLTVAKLWCVSALLVLWGSYHGYEHEALKFPTATSDIARPVPPPSRRLSHPVVGMTLAGVVPFAAAYVELFFIMTSLWMNLFYYVFGFTLLVYIILIVTCAELTVILVFYQLRAENHRWWWYAFLTSGSVAFYVFLFSIFWFEHLDVSGMVATYLLYFGYMFLMSLAVFLAFGCVGALTSLWFVRKIFFALDK
jgi:transmembrane 9 superfamily member 2/4